MATINTTTADATAAGDHGATGINGLAFEPAEGTLYGSSYSSDPLYSIDATTGAAIQIGLVGGGRIQGLAISIVDGLPCGPDYDSTELVRIDKTTGSDTPAGSLDLGTVRALCPAPLAFADGFESGDPLRWSSVSP